MISFERDLDAFALALAHPKRFGHLRHEAPHRLAIAGAFERDGLRWSLCPGDFLATFGAQPAPDVIFYDPFSAKVDGPMWTLAAFRGLFAAVAGREPVELFTYTTSTAVRSSMLAAGFHVAHGAGSGPKAETTIALVPGSPGSSHRLLGRDWLDRRARSTARFGADIPADERDAVETCIQVHPQFRESVGRKCPYP
jgi:queuine tRNA-ribosyltransferase